MGIVRNPRDPDQPGRPAARIRAASQPEAARTAVRAALDGLVGTGLATWHKGWEDGVELRGIDGEAWLLDDSGVTRVR